MRKFAFRANKTTWWPTVTPPPPYRTEQNRKEVLGLSASLLAGGTARLPQLLPGPGPQLTRNPELQKP
jgi:hypothetical protein